MDIGLALCFGDQPLFFRDEMLWESYIAAHNLIGKSHVVIFNEELSAFTRTLDKRLAIIQKDLHEFSLISNLAYQTKRSIDPNMFNEMMVSVLYRLLYLGFQGDPLNEIIRIGMVAFASSIFLRWRGTRQRNDYWTYIFRDGLLKMQARETNYPPAIQVWLLFTFAIYTSAGSYKDDWLYTRLEEALELLHIRTWDEARPVLKSVMWIDFLHDPVGSNIFKTLNKSVKS